ncbi:acylneuraminate cytidylyltransferase [Oceanobacillus zhaokaii]|uniref:Acylneuraminate cytidylyltransferase n=1 Tax=Oceanobacillus zhaokaii TaxID=2052660 RepID=A0A345PKB1_9BACI|nr:acylneuraminate cytidylyltransferase family protein [Oceanobacillus zhaokaii]AXI10441.1 acylneuraminate cytidylyltransferase [Oceanobacillus zhaokaii]
MYKEKKFLAIIPARGGSIGIPRKNLVKINNEPLIQYTIDEALSSKYLDEIIVSTEDQEIAQVAKQLGANVPYLRPYYLASDTSKTVDAIMHVIEKQREHGFEYDYVVILQPTQPLRKSWHIDDAIENIVKYYQESLVSVSKVKEHPLLIRKLNVDNVLEPLLKMSSTVRRQDFEDYYKINGAIYINKINSNLTKNTSFNDNKFAYVMDGQYDIDIDEKFDLEVFKLMLRKKRE